MPGGAAVGDDAVEAVEHRRGDGHGHLRRRRHLRGGEPHLQRRVGRVGAHTPRPRRTGRPSSSTAASSASTAPARSIPPPAPPGEVVVEGVLLESEQRGRFGPTDPDERHARGARPRRPRAGRRAGGLRRAARLPPADAAATRRRSRRRGDPELVAARTPRSRPRARTSPTRCSGSSSPPSRWSATRCCCDGSRATRRGRRPARRPIAALDRELRGAARRGTLRCVDPTGRAPSDSCHRHHRVLGAMGFRAAGTVAPVSTPSDPRTLVMHGLRLKGFGERRGRR